MQYLLSTIERDPRHTPEREVELTGGGAAAQPPAVSCVGNGSSVWHGLWPGGSFFLCFC
jgi:hypothetical protein